MDDSEEDFNALYAAIRGSRVFREAVSAALPGLPSWLVPFSVVDQDVLIRLSTALNVHAQHTFLDFGCGAGGPGLFVAKRTGAAMIGVDSSAVAIQAAQELASELGLTERVTFRVEDALETGLADASIDGVLSVDVMMFLDARAAAELARVIKPNGILVMTATESLVEPFLPTLVRRYKPIFQGSSFSIMMYEHYAERHHIQKIFYKELRARGTELHSEIGALAFKLAR